MEKDQGKSQEEQIGEVRVQEQAQTPAAKRKAAEKKRRINIYSGVALRAKKAKDARAYAEALRLGNVLENSPEWAAAWKYFYS